MDTVYAIMGFLLMLGDVTACVYGTWLFSQGEWQKGTGVWVLAISCFLRARALREDQ